MAKWPKGFSALSPRLWAPMGISLSPISHLRMTGFEGQGQLSPWFRATVHGWTL